MIKKAIIAAAFAATAATAIATQPMAMVNIPVACVRDTCAHSSELLTQALLGTPVAVSDTLGDWIGVTLPDGYCGYINRSGLTAISDSAFAALRRTPRLMAVCSDMSPVVSDSTGHGSRLTYLVNGSIVCGELKDGANFVQVTLPDGSAGYANAADLTPLAIFADSPTDTDLALATAESAAGAPYLWGGTTLLSPDCSGLVTRAYFAAGLIVPRDASKQALAGVEIPADRSDLWMRGDLLFFSPEGTADPSHITHVAIYDRRGRFVHSSGKVFTASTDPTDPLFLDRKVVKVVRIAGFEDTPGITRLTSHPWYF